MNELINDEAVDRTAPATPGLLKISLPNMLTVLLSNSRKESFKKNYPSSARLARYIFHVCVKWNVTMVWGLLPTRLTRIVNRPGVAGAVLQTPS